MLTKLPGNRRYLVYAILIHIAFVAIIVFSLDWMPRPHRAQAPQNVVQAIAVDEKRLKAEAEKKQAEERRKQQEKEEKIREEKRAREEEERRQLEVKQKREEEQRQLKEQEARQQAEAKKVKEQEQRRKEQEALQKKQKEDEARLAEQKRKQEEQRALQEQIAAEQRQLEAEREQKIQSILDRYIEIIKQKVTRNWFRPASAQENLSCTVMVRLIPGGEVLDVRIVKSSGDPVFDRSVETAVLKASPLPLPPDPALFERFRMLQFVFKPEG